jgi:hypothetical protein
VFSVVNATLVAKQRCGKHISTAINQHATTEEAVFSVELWKYTILGIM